MKKHIINPEQMGYKKKHTIDGYVIKFYRRVCGTYWGDYVVSSDNLGFEIFTTLHGNHAPVALRTKK